MHGAGRTRENTCKENTNNPTEKKHATKNYADSGRIYGSYDMISGEISYMEYVGGRGPEGNVLGQ